jgi:DNA polymerase-3 subunit epsilon
LVSEKLGIAFNHHNASEDAEVTALLFKQILQESAIQSLEEINDFIDTNYVKLSNRFRTSTPLGRKLNIELTENEAHPFFGKEVVFSGTFSAFTKEGGRELVAKIGGVPKESVTSNTKFLVVGQQDMYRVGLEMKSSKMKKVEQMISKRLDVQVLIESEFIELLNF